MSKVLRDSLTSQTFFLISKMYLILKSDKVLRYKQFFAFPLNFEIEKLCDFVIPKSRTIEASVGLKIEMGCVNGCKIEELTLL